MYQKATATNHVKGETVKTVVEEIIYPYTKQVLSSFKIILYVKYIK